MFPSVLAASGAILVVVIVFVFLWFLPKPNVRGDVVVLLSAAIAVALVCLFGSGFRSLGFREPVNALWLGLQVVGLVVTTIAVKALVVDLLAVRLLGVPAQDFTDDETVYRKPRLLAKQLWQGWYAGSVEEVLFRGFLQTSVLQVASVVGNAYVANGAAIMVPALLFGIVHQSQGVAGVITAATVGIWFGAWFALNGQDLLPLIIAHCMINSISYVFMFFVPPVRVTADH